MTYQTEMTEQGEQTILPGAEKKAERITDRQLAERRMIERTKSKKPQKPYAPRSMTRDRTSRQRRKHRPHNAR